MEDLEIKKRFEIVQRVMNLCISSLYTFYEESIIRKKSVLEFSRLKSMLQDESIRITDELSQLYLTYPIIACVQQYYHEKEFLWESTFYESLDKEQKSKWLSYSPLYFQLSTFTTNHTAYDKELPYFSIVVRAIVLERYSHFLGAVENQWGLVFQYPEEFRPLPYGKESIGSACAYRAAFRNTGSF